jgi:DNA-binding NarL/FixJ family response regulator
VYVRNQGAPFDGDLRAASPEAIIAVVVLENRALIRESLAALVGQQDNFLVIGQARDAEQARSLGVVPDVVVADIDRDGFADEGVVVRLRPFFPRSGIVVLTDVAHPAKVQAALDAGADGYVLTTSTRRDLMVAIRAVANGQSYLQPSLGVELARWRGPRRPEDLSRKEEHVLALLAAGHTNAHISQRLGTSLRTVESYRARLRQKLGRSTRAEFFEYACRAGLIDAR